MHISRCSKIREKIREITLHKKISKLKRELSRMEKKISINLNLALVSQKIVLFFGFSHCEMYARNKELLYVQIFAKKGKKKKINQKLDAREQTTIKHLLLKNWMKEEKVLETLNLKTFLEENTKRGKTTRNARDFVLKFMILMWRT